MTLMGGPIDTRRNPTDVNKLAEGKPIEWFERNVDRDGAVPARRASCAASIPASCSSRAS